MRENSYLISYSALRHIHDSHECRLLSAARHHSIQAYVEVWVIRQLQVCEQILDLHALEEFVAPYDPTRYSALLQLGLNDA